MSPTNFIPHHRKEKDEARGKQGAIVSVSGDVRWRRGRGWRKIRRQQNGPGPLPIYSLYGLSAFSFWRKRLQNEGIKNNCQQ
jgi:hypothetical protein